MIKSMVYSNREKNSNKFYIIEIISNLDSYKVITKNSRLGSKNPRVTEKSFSSLCDAEVCYWGIIKRKKTEGYRVSPRAN